MKLELLQFVKFVIESYWNPELSIPWEQKSNFLFFSFMKQFIVDVLNLFIIIF